MPLGFCGARPQDACACPAGGLSACVGERRASVVIPVWDGFAGVGWVRGGLLSRAVASVRVESSCPVSVIGVDNASLVPVDVPDAQVPRLPVRVSVGQSREHR